LLALCMFAGLATASAIPAAASSELTSGGWYATANEAALGFANSTMPLTRAEGVEYGAVVYRSFNWGTFRLGYTYTTPYRGTENMVNHYVLAWFFLAPWLSVATAHTHVRGNDFSPADISGANNRRFLCRYSYVATPNGSLRRFDTRTQANELVYSGLTF